MAMWTEAKGQSSAAAHCFLGCKFCGNLKSLGEKKAKYMPKRRTRVCSPEAHGAQMPMKRWLHSARRFPSPQLVECAHCPQVPDASLTIRWFSSVPLWKKSSFQGHRPSLVPTRPRRVRARCSSTLTHGALGSSSAAQTLLLAGIKILSCVASGKLLNFTVPHFPTCTSTTKAPWCLGHMWH